MKKLILMLVVYCAISCTKKEEPVVVAPYVPQTIAPILIGKGSLFRGSNNIISSNPNQVNFSLNNTIDWNNFKESFTLPTNINVLLSETIIDFNLWQVIAVIDKPQVKSDSRIDISSVVENENNIVVQVQKFSILIAGDTPSRGFHIVKIPASSKPIVFQVNEPI